MNQLTTERTSSTTSLHLDPLSDPVVSPLARLHREQEERWRDFIDRNYPGGRLLRWSPQHRVFRCGNRVVKVEWETISTKDSTRGLAYEFSLLEALEGRASRLAPSYKVIDGSWCVLEMDWIEGNYLDDLIAENRAREVSILRLIIGLFRVSLAGVVYKQLRARHVIQRADGELVFIDFGHSSHAGRLDALWRNFAPLTFASGSWRWGLLISMIREILRRRKAEESRDDNAVRRGDDALSRALRCCRVNDRRTPRARPEHLTNYPGDPIAAQHFLAMEQCLGKAIEADPLIGPDFLKFQFADYGMAGSRDWGFIWDHLARRVDFAGKKVVDLACGMGGVGAYARLYGAVQVVSCDRFPVILDAARHFSEALGFADNAYHQFDWADLETGAVELPVADILTALSSRLDNLPRGRWLEILTHYPEILWQTADAKAGQRDLEALGYRTVEILEQADVDQYILYATDRRI